MRKSNVIIFTVATLVSIFLLWLWYYLGFNFVDNPLDLVLTIIWWCLIVAFAFSIRKVEKTRQRKIRTMFIGSGVLFNSETGLLNISQTPSVENAMTEVLENLEYGFDRQELPDTDALSFDYIVHSDKFEFDKDSGEVEKWEGDVVFVADAEHEAHEFESVEELREILAAA